MGNSALQDAMSRINQRFHIAISMDEIHHSIHDSTMPDLSPNLRFDDSFTRKLPADSCQHNSPHQVHHACYSQAVPAVASNPRTIAYASEVAELLDLPDSWCNSRDFSAVFSGNRLLPGMKPYASNYGGHQFGHWAGQLGDGRAINLGEVINSRGERWTLQLKGAGPTPYSRRADGFAVLRSSIREFLCSEAMFHLGVPTTRALSIITRGDQVIRDMFYDGRPQLEPTATVCRVAPSFIRFGHFQLPAMRGEHALLQQLLDYTINHHFPHLASSSECYIEWFDEVCRTTMDMVVQWMRVGFVHGVMNTDNMSILGLTIDYGPYGWLERYDPNWTPNTTDREHQRYSFGKQAQIAIWNLAQLGRAILPLTHEVEPLQQCIKRATDHYQQQWLVMMRAKLGLERSLSEDHALIQSLMKLLPQAETDMTIFFRLLTTLPQSTDAKVQFQHLQPAYYDLTQQSQIYQQQMLAWLQQYQQRLNLEVRSPADRIEAMQRTNPKYVLRNYLAQQAIDLAEQGDYSGIHELLDLLRHPYDEQQQYQHYASKQPEWARMREGCSMLSCSS